ncbi:MAG: HD domain-containing phosphohydrolase [Candidatus Sericytochromatia bacterium]|nr:HD domain-containing phosphohydrolase [Candidatus Sericytochromatia bacterium]
MSSLPDWIQLLGYLFFAAALLVALYFLWPGGEPPRPTAAPATWPRRKAAPPRAPHLEDVAALIERTDAHERYPAGHAARVARLASALAHAVGVEREERGRIHQAALLHDLGMLDVATDLVAKPQLLTQAEFLQVARHTLRGAARALEITGDREVAGWVRWSHERWDGLGFPDGLAGEQIPLGARILRLADSAEAMLQDRPYRPALVPDEVKAEINRLAGIAFDPMLAAVFVDYVLPRQLLQEVEGAEAPGPEA